MTTLFGPIDVVTAAGRKEARRRDLRLVTLAWVFGAVWMTVVMGTVMQEFLRTVGTPAWAFGMVGAIPMVAGLSQLPASLIVDSFGCRKKLFMVLATASRCLFIVVGLIPWLLPGLADWWWRLALGTVAAAWLLGQASGPAWMQWMSDVIPRRVRGRYFAFRGQVGHVVGVTTALVTGYLLDQLGGQAGDADAQLRFVAAAMLIVAGVMGVLDIQCFHPIRDEVEPARTGRHLWPRIAAALRQRKLWLFLAFSFTMQLACGGLAGYVYLFLRSEIGLSMTMLSVCLTLLPAGVVLLGLRFWGRMIDRVGPERVLAACALLVLFGPVCWLFITREVFWPGYVTMLVGPFAWPGLGQASFQVTMELSAKADAARVDGGRRKSASAEASAPDAAGGGAVNVALVSIAGAAGAVLSGVWMGAVAKAGAGFHFEPQALGIALTWHHLIFASSMAIRFVAVLLAMAMVAKAAPRIRDAMRRRPA